jgi:flagellar capping protein FliD
MDRIDKEIDSFSTNLGAKLRRIYQQFTQMVFIK